MTQDFEYNSYNDADRIAILESRAAELERRLLAFVPPDPATGWRNVVLPGGRQTEPEELPAAGDPDPDDLAGQPAEQPGALGPDGRTEALIPMDNPRTLIRVNSLFLRKVRQAGRR